MSIKYQIVIYTKVKVSNYVLGFMVKCKYNIHSNALDFVTLLLIG